MSERKYCEETNKKCYSQKEASDVIRKAKKARNSHRPKTIPKRSYKCEFCGYFHLTHYSNKQTCKATIRRYGYRGWKDYQYEN
jgi:hypothetical protein